MARYEEQKRTFDQLKAELKQKSVGNFYVFYGEESYLRSYYLGQMHKLLVDDFSEAFNYHHLTAENLSPQILADCIEALPMMAERSMVQVDDVDFFKLPESEREDYGKIFSDLPVYCTVVLVYDTVEYKPDKRMKRLWQAMEKALAVEFQRPTERELAVWIARHFKPRGKTICYELCQYLIQRTGGSMSAMLSEIEKVAAFATAGEITQEDIDAVVEPVLDAVVFDLSDAIAGGRFETAMMKLVALMQMQEEPIHILGAISTQMRRILTAKTLIDNGKGIHDLMALCGLKNYPAQKTLGFAKRLPQHFCERAVLLCLETDEKMKTSYDDSDRLLELLVLQLAQEARND